MTPVGDPRSSTKEPGAVTCLPCKQETLYSVILNGNRLRFASCQMNGMTILGNFSSVFLVFPNSI